MTKGIKGLPTPAIWPEGPQKKFLWNLIIYCVVEWSYTYINNVYKNKIEKKDTCAFLNAPFKQTGVEGATSYGLLLALQVEVLFIGIVQILAIHFHHQI